MLLFLKETLNIYSYLVTYMYNETDKKIKCSFSYSKTHVALAKVHLLKAVNVDYNFCHESVP